MLGTGGGGGRLVGVGVGVGVVDEMYFGVHNSISKLFGSAADLMLNEKKNK